MKVLLLSLLLPLSGGAFANAWSKLTKHDLKAIQSLLKVNHPGAKDRINTDFSKWLKRGYQEALARSNKVESIQGYYFTIQAFINGFQDGHLGLSDPMMRNLNAYQTSPFQNIQWPGFVVGYRNDSIIITHVKDNQTQIKQGAKLLSCDGMEAKELARHRIFQFRGITSLPAHWHQFAPFLFLDEQNPFLEKLKQCTFQQNGSELSLALQWKKVQDLKVFNDHFRAAKKRANGHDAFSLHPLDEKNSYWMSLPSFSLSSDNKQALNRMIHQLSKRPSPGLLIIDLRGNTGGNSAWGSKVTRTFFGEEYLKSLNEKTSTSMVDYRVSKGNLNHWKTVLPYLEKDFGKASEFVMHFDEVIEKMTRALKKKENFIRMGNQTEGQLPVQKRSLSHNVSGNIYVLTDTACASACLDFLDLMLPAKNVTHIGLPTSGDTLYMEVRSEALPSNFFTLNFATKVYRNRVRGHNAFYSPDYVWDGDIKNTKEIQHWILNDLNVR